MKNLIIKIDEKYFGKFFIKFYRSFYSIKRIQSSHKNWVTTLKDLRQYTLLTYWNMLFNLLETNKVEGDIVECGVGNGTTLSFILFNLVRNDMHRDRLYFGFDSFEGFPEPDLNDKNSIKISKKGDYGHIDEKFVLDNLISLGFKKPDFKKIKFIKGFYENSFSQEYKDITKISILHIDCDLYSSTKISLETWFDKVEKNGLIVFDEYLNSPGFPGAAKAIDEFLGEDKNKIKMCPISNHYYLIKN